MLSFACTSFTALLFNLYILIATIPSSASAQSLNSNPTKYFQENPLAGHLDLRFSPLRPDPATAHQPNHTALVDLVRSYVLTMQDLGVET